MPIPANAGATSARFIPELGATVTSPVIGVRAAPIIMVSLLGTLWRMSASLFRNNPSLVWDYRLGLRGFGLIVYGTLPASLAALGAIKADIAKLKPIGALPLLLIAVVAAAPFLLTLVLVRQRLRNWYLMRDWLWLRATIITLGIVVASSVVCLATGVLSGTYQLIGWDVWSARPLLGKLKPFIESLLLSMAYLVGSSTLFLAVIKEEGTLPLLPGKAEIENVNALRQRLKAVLDKLKAPPPATDNAARAMGQELVAGIGQCRESLEALEKQGTQLGRGQLYRELGEQLDALRSAALELGNPGAYRIYWEKPAPANISDAQRRRREIIEQLMEVSVGG